MITVDPTKLEQVLERLDPEGIRVLAWLLALADEDGALVGSQMRLARKVGFTGTAALQPVIERLAAVSFKARPLLSRDVFKGKPRLRLIGPPGLIRAHGRSAATITKPAAPVPAQAMRNRRRAAPPQDLAKVLSIRQREVEAYSAVVSQRVEAWLALLASHQVDKQMSLASQVLQYEAIFELLTKFGPDPVEEALLIGLRMLESDPPKGKPDQLLRKLTTSVVEQAARPDPTKAFRDRRGPRPARPAAGSSGQAEPEGHGEPEPTDEPEFPPDSF